MTWPEPPGSGPLGDGRFASAAERPETIDALGDAVARRAGEGLAIYPQGGRTSLDYGTPPRRPGAAIDTRGLARVIDYPAADMTITVEAGMTLAALQTTLAEHRQRLPLDPPQADRATLGGIYATNASGPRRFGAGRPRDFLLGIGFVTADGKLVKGGGRVVKNVAGYDLPKLLTGSMGTLGIIAQMTLKVLPIPEASALAWATLPDPEAAATALDRLNTSATRPIALELLNPSAAASLAGPLDLPGGGWALAVGFEDNAASVAWQVDRLRDELAGLAAEVAVREGPAADPLWSALAGFPASGPGPVAIEAGLPTSAVAPFAAALDPARWAVAAHAGSGIVRGLIRADADLDAVAAEVDRLRTLASRHGGHLTVPRGPTAWKDRLKVWGDPRPDWALADRVKRALDPGAVMNPGRFVGTIEGSAPGLPAGRPGAGTLPEG